MNKKYTSVLVALFAGALLATIATHLAIYQQADFFRQWFSLLLIADAVFILLLLLAVVWVLRRLVISWRRGERGARLSLRLTLLFWGMALLPTLLLYSVSVSAVFRGVETWFDTPLGKSFESGITFGQDVIGNEFERLEYVARELAPRVPKRPEEMSFYIDNVRLIYSLDAIALYDRRGEIVVASGDVSGRLSTTLVNRVITGGLHLNLRGSGIDRATEVAVPLPAEGEVAVLMISRPLPAEIAEGIAAIQHGQQEYEKLQVLRSGLRWSFILTMSLSLVLILFLIGWLSLRLGRRLTRPLVHLSAAAESVGSGNFVTRLREDYPLDEIAHLNRSFNAMAEDLRNLHEEIADRQSAIEKTNAYLENLLSSLTTGVLTFAADGSFSGYNAAAVRYCQLPLDSLLGQKSLPSTPLITAFNEIAAALTQQNDEDSMEKRVEVPGGAVLLVRAVALPALAGGGMLMIIEDISRQLRAEREATWEEASRRFVHEIKNPLTPIQLAAERLEHKLAGRLPGEEDRMLRRLVEMIVNQVEAMRQMVNAFRDYADQQSASQFVPLYLDVLLREVLYFYENRQVTFDLDLPGVLPPVKGNAVTLRQLLHNLLGNAADAVGAAEQPVVRISISADADWVTLCIEDNGGGVPADLLEKLCEPYVTTKLQGTGLGLAMVRKISDEHNGKLSIKNAAHGLAVTVRLAVYQTPDS